MKTLTLKIHETYLKFFQFLVHDRLEKRDMDLRHIHYHVAMVASTGLLMWGYTIIALLTIESPIPGIVGIFCSLVHNLSPFLFRFSNRSFMICNTALGSGMIFEIVFSSFSGGFKSPKVMWFPVLPMLGGIVSGRRGIKTWGILSFSTLLIFFILELINVPFPNQLSPSGFTWSLSLLRFGWLFLIFSMILVYVTMKESSETILEEQGKKIDDLFRVLFHDLANSLGRVNIGLAIARKNENNPQTTRGIQIISEASESMFEITQNVRNMYAASKGKSDVGLTPTSLNTSIEYIQKIFFNDLDKKKIKVEYDFEKCEGLSLLVEPISFKNQVLGNIISNAIKFSHPGGIIEIMAYPVNQTNFALEIRDSGIGMPETLVPQLFDLSKKTTRPGTSGEEGTGFGMHIMKSFVEMYQGQISVESMEEKGTMFRIILKGEWV